jgi:hypothetical protein
MPESVLRSPLFQENLSEITSRRRLVSGAQAGIEGSLVFGFGRFILATVPVVEGCRERCCPDAGLLPKMAFSDKLGHYGG